jgi:hypothetical protein
MTSTDRSTAAWTAVGRVAPDALHDARLQIHHATQVVVSATISYLVARPDDSHTAMSWSAPVRALVSEPIDTPRAREALRVALRPADLTFLALGADDGVSSSFPADGRTVVEATDWLRGVASRAGLDPARVTTRKHYEIAPHPVAEGDRFAVEPRAAFAELEAYWVNAAALLAVLARETPGASAVRCWPHHFDIATLITLPSSAGRATTIGVGHSPGDEWYDEPYWYVGPNPYPEARDLPALPDGGRWHTERWFGAVLTASSYAGRAGDEQPGAVGRFVAASVRACRTLLAR